MIKTKENQHFYWLDSIRFIAAFMVLLSHARNTFFPAFGDLPACQHNVITMAFTMLCRMGHEAVIIFFVLSGFLVGGRGFERINNGSMNIKSYAIDRISRIYPPLLAAILFCVITSSIVPEMPKDCFSPIEWSTVLGNLFSLQGICCKSLVSPFWSLSYEVWFYIILGALAVLLLTKNEYTKVIGFIVFVGSVSVFTMGLKMHNLFIWCMGAIAYLTRPQKRNVCLFLASFVGFFAGVVYYQLSKDTHSVEFAVEGTNKELLSIFLSLMACLFIQQVILFQPHKKCAQKIEKCLGYLAKFSYTLYLSHRIVFVWIVTYLFSPDSCDFSVNGILRFLSIVLITLFICWLIYLISERYSPMIKNELKAKLL